MPKPRKKKKAPIVVIDDPRAALPRVDPSLRGPELVASVRTALQARLAGAKGELNTERTRDRIRAITVQFCQELIDQGVLPPALDFSRIRVVGDHDRVILEYPEELRALLVTETS